MNYVILTNTNIYKINENVNGSAKKQKNNFKSNFKRANITRYIQKKNTFIQIQIQF